LPDPAVDVWRPWEGVVAVILAVVAEFFATLPVIFIFGRTTNGAIAFSVVAGEIAIFVVAVAWARTRHHMTLGDLGWRTKDARGDAAAGVGAGLLGFVLQVPLLYVGLFIGRLIKPGLKTPDQLPYEGHPGAMVLFFSGLGAIILAPIAEELLFRGILYRSFRTRLGITRAAIVAGAIFGIVHGYPLLFLPIGVLGYILARVFERRKSLLADTVGHSLFNLLGFILIVANLK